MEGDLLGIDFGQTTGPSQIPHALQSNVSGGLQVQPPSKQTQPFGVLPSPAEAQPDGAQQPPVQLAPPPAAAHNATQSVQQLLSAQLTPPPVVVQLSLAHPAPPKALIQTYTQQYQPPEGQQEYYIQQHPPSVEEPIPQSNTLASANGSPIDAQYAANVQQIVQTIWKPSSTQDEPKDPILLEIKQRFAGRWKLARSDPYDEYLRAAGVGIFARKLAIAGPLEQHIEVKGNSIHIDFHSTFSNQINVFRLEESMENLVEKSRQSVFCSYKDGKLTLLMTPLEPGMNRTQEVERYINEHGELVSIYTCGTASCRRYFFRLADLVSPLNIVG